MKKALLMLKTVLRRIWAHASAVVAVALIIAAFVAGRHIGTPPPDTGHAEVTVSPAGQPGGDAEVQYYTCSMHPSVRLTDPDAKCPICGMDLIPVGEHSVDTGTLTLSHEAAVASRVETAEVARYFPEAAVRLYGKVTYDETSVARLTAYFPGRIDRLFVNYVGVSVNKGDHLAEVYSPELLAAFEELRQAAEAVRNASEMSGLVRDATRDTLEAAREKLRLFGLRQEQIRAVEDGSFNSDHFTIFAPIGGVVTHLGVREGDYVNTGAAIATVADLSRLWIDMEAYESQLPLLRWGQQVTFTVEAHPGEVFRGRISFIEPIVDEETRTAAVRVAVENPNGRLKPGMFASAVVHAKVGQTGALPVEDIAGEWVCPMHPTQTRATSQPCPVCGMDMVPASTLLGEAPDHEAAPPPLVIPKSAVLFTGVRSVVYVAHIGEDETVYEAREVILGPRAGDLYVVRRGLEVGERVVVNGAFRIDSAMQIAAKPSMMSPRNGGEATDHAGMEGMTQTSGSSASPAGGVFTKQLTPVYDAYLDAQGALAGDDLEAFNTAVRTLDRALGDVREAGLVGDAVKAWRRALGLLRTADAPASIDEARSRFETMSEGVIILLREFGPPEGETLNLAHCPMAFDFKGADWVQRGDQIRNPYFGSEMLTCGSIKRSFQKNPGDSSDGGTRP